MLLYEVAIVLPTNSANVPAQIHGPTPVYAESEDAATAQVLASHNLRDGQPGVLVFTREFRHIVLPEADVERKAAPRKRDE
jgi:hypothetical protein